MKTKAQLELKFEDMGNADLLRTMIKEHELLYKAQFYTGFLQSTDGTKLHKELVDRIQDLELSILTMSNTK